MVTESRIGLWLGFHCDGPNVSVYLYRCVSEYTRRTIKSIHRQPLADNSTTIYVNFAIFCRVFNVYINLYLQSYLSVRLIIKKLL